MTYRETEETCSTNLSGRAMFLLSTSWTVCLWNPWQIHLLSLVRLEALAGSVRVTQLWHCRGLNGRLPLLPEARPLPEAEAPLLPLPVPLPLPFLRLWRLPPPALLAALSLPICTPSAL